MLEVMAYSDDVRILIREKSKVSENDRAVVTTVDNFTEFVKQVKRGEYDAYCTRQHILSGD